MVLDAQKMEILMEKILVIQTAFLGDAILTLPMIQKLDEMYPMSEIDVLAIPSTKDVFIASPYINEVLVIDKKGKEKSVFSLFKYAGELQDRKYTRIYSPHRSLRTSLIVMQSGVKDTTGFDNAAFKHIYKDLVAYKEYHHEVQRNLDLIGYRYEGEGWRVLPEIKVPVSSKERVELFIRRNNIRDPYYTVAPGSVWDTKKYPEEYFIDVIKFLAATGFPVILVGGKKEKELCERIALLFPGKVWSAAGKMSITETIFLLGKSLLLISNDSAPVHMGMCVDIPVLTLYCSTVPDFGFYPYNYKSSHLSYSELSCKPCGIHGYKECPLTHFECGKRLYPSEVISKIKEMIDV
jgi:heptosyltransferase II